jgi:hypothetical protein
MDNTTAGYISLNVRMRKYGRTGAKKPTANKTGDNWHVIIHMIREWQNDKPNHGNYSQLKKTPGKLHTAFAVSFNVTHSESTLSRK